MNGGQLIWGLVNRRATEAGLSASGEFVSSADVPAKPAAPPVLTKETVTWGASIAATVGSSISGSGPVQWALAMIIIMAFAAGAYSLLRDRLRPA